MSEQFSYEYGGVLPCGGRGTRLASLSKDEIPKSLFKVAGKELIRYSTEVLSPHIVKSLVLAVDYKAEAIKAWAHEAQLPYIVKFSEQTEPGVLGSIVAGSQHLEEDRMITCNTDEIRLGLNLAEVVSFHESQGTLATMVTTYTDHLSRHRIVEVNESGIVTSTKLKPEKYRNYPEQTGLVNTGFLIINKEAMDYFDATHSHDWSGIIDPLCEAGQLSTYVDDKIRFFNVGTPEEYRDATAFLEQKS